MHPSRRQACLRRHAATLNTALSSSCRPAFPLWPPPPSSAAGSWLLPAPAPWCAWALVARAPAGKWGGRAVFPYQLQAWPLTAFPLQAAALYPSWLPCSSKCCGRVWLSKVLNGHAHLTQQQLCLPRSHGFMFKLEVCCNIHFSVPSGISSNCVSHCASVQLPRRRG